MQGRNPILITRCGCRSNSDLHFHDNEPRHHRHHRHGDWLLLHLSGSSALGSASRRACPSRNRSPWGRCSVARRRSATERNTSRLVIASAFLLPLAGFAVIASRGTIGIAAAFVARLVLSVLRRAAENALRDVLAALEMSRVLRHLVTSRTLFPNRMAMGIVRCRVQAMPDQLLMMLPVGRRPFIHALQDS